MYGQELFEFVGSSVNANAAVGAVYTKRAYVPGAVVYWGVQVITAFVNTSPVANGLLTLYRYTKKIQSITVNAGGTGYAVGDLFSITQAGASGGVGRVKTITAATGAVLTAEVVTDGINYAYGSPTSRATVALNGAGANDLTVYIDDRIALDTLGYVTGYPVGKHYMRRVPNVLSDISPASAGPAAYNAGEDLVIVQTTAANGTGNTGAYYPVLICQNRGENFAAQELWVPANITDVI
jgi:hypothetical protein